MTEENNSLLQETDSETTTETTTETTETVAKPENIPDEFWDTESNSIKSDTLLEAYNQESKKALGLRQKLSEKGSVKPPKETSEYAYDESINDIVGSDSDSLKLLKESALKSGLSKDQFKNLTDNLIPAMSEAGLINKTLTKEEEQEEFAQFQKEEIAKLGDGGDKILQNINNWGNSLLSKGTFSEDDLSHFKDMVIESKDIVVFNKLMSLTGEKPIPLDTNNSSPPISRVEIESIMATDEYQNPTNPKYEMTHNKVEKMFSQLSK